MSQVKVLKDKCRKQRDDIKMAKKLSRTKVFLKYIDKLPEPINLFTKMQLKNASKPRGRRFSLNEKIMSLTILKQSPKAYNYLRQMFVLPSKRSLQTLLSLFSVKPGLNLHILKDLQSAVRLMPDEKRIVNLMFDEISLCPGVTYDPDIDAVIGFEDMGSNSRNKTLADHALVFMIKSVKSKCKQPICFTFCKSSTKAIHLKNLIKNIVLELQNIGFIVITVICDQARTNVNALKNLHQDTREKYLKEGHGDYIEKAIEIGGKKIFPLFDPPHLLKGVRNNLLIKDALFVQDGVMKRAKWDHIRMLLDVDDGDDEIRLVNKLTEAHVIKEKIPKMKVKFAAQIFSQRVSSAMRFLASECCI